MKNEQLNLNAIQLFLNSMRSGWKYGFPSDEENRKVSCRHFVRKAYKEIGGIVIPWGYFSAEIFLCKDGFFYQVQEYESPEVLDIFCSGVPGITSSKKIHLSIFLGGIDLETGEPIVHEFSKAAGGYSEKPLYDSLAMNGHIFYGRRRFAPEADQLLKVGYNHIYDRHAD